MKNANAISTIRRIQKDRQRLINAARGNGKDIDTIVERINELFADEDREKERADQLLDEIEQIANALDLDGWRGAGLIDTAKRIQEGYSLCYSLKTKWQSIAALFDYPQEKLNKTDINDIHQDLLATIDGLIKKAEAFDRMKDL